MVMLLWLCNRWLCRALYHSRFLPAVVLYNLNQAQYFKKMLEICGLMDDPDRPKAGKHGKLERAEIRKSEEAAQCTTFAIRNFTNPFSLVDKDHLYSVASGAPEVELDVLHAEAAGKEAKEMFI